MKEIVWPGLLSVIRTACAVCSHASPYFIRSQRSHPSPYARTHYGPYACTDDVADAEPNGYANNVITNVVANRDPCSGCELTPSLVIGLLLPLGPSRGHGVQMI